MASRRKTMQQNLHYQTKETATAKSGGFQVHANVTSKCQSSGLNWITKYATREIGYANPDSRNAKNKPGASAPGFKIAQRNLIAGRGTIAKRTTALERRKRITEALPRRNGPRDNDEGHWTCHREWHRQPMRPWQSKRRFRAGSRR
jgi:hypothetical protein